MKKNVVLSVVAVLLVVGVGISFAYFVSEVLFSGTGSEVSATTGELMDVVYDGDAMLNTSNLMPGDTVTKTFRVTVTPTETENEVTYAIKLNITENTFVACDDSTYDSITNACDRDTNELVYRLRNENNQVIAEGSLIGVLGEEIIITETKTATAETTYNYTLEIEFVETNADQNHNMEKVINGSIEVEFGIPPAKDVILASANRPTGQTTDWTNNGTGITYYYTGSPNNWVQFAGFWWRIIRINGDGTIRMIYQGVADSATPDSGNIMGEGTTIGNSRFNYPMKNNAHVGYMYGNINASDYAGTHANTNSSTIKGVLDQWYSNNLATNYEQYIDGNAGFCGDRRVSSGTGTGTSSTYYAAYNRLVENNNPNLQCDSRDVYTTTDSSAGNKSLTYPIGLISVDEAMFSGIPWSGINQNNYLYTGETYWTMSPSDFDSEYNNAYVFNVNNYGSLFHGNGFNSNGVRPVINLKSDISLIGSGTMDDPFKLSS